MSMGNNWANKIDPDGRFDTKFGAWLYKVFNGTGGEIFENDYGQFGIDISDGTIEGGVDMIFGSNWERNFSSGNLFNESFSNLVQFGPLGDGGSLSSSIKTQISLNISKIPNLDRPVRMEDYTFTTNVSSESYGGGVDKSNTKTRAHIRIGIDGEEAKRMLAPFQSKKGGAYMTSSLSIGSLSHAFGVAKSVNNLLIRVHVDWGMDNGSASGDLPSKVPLTLGNVPSKINNVNILNFD